MGRGPLPDGSTRMWSPITSTLIMGTHDALLVDPPMTNTQAADVGDSIEASGRQLRRRLYVTHGHGDHWFGAIPIGGAVSGRGRASHKRHQATDGRAEQRRVPRRLLGIAFFPVSYPPVRSTSASSMNMVSSSRVLACCRLKWVTPTPTRRRCCMRPRSVCWWPVTSSTTTCTSYLTESGGVTGIDQWLAALDIAEALEPIAVIAGHKSPQAADDPSQIQATREYLTHARQLLTSSTRAEEFYDAMLGLHPHRINPGALWGAAMTLLPQG